MKFKHYTHRHIRNDIAQREDTHRIKHGHDLRRKKTTQGFDFKRFCAFLRISAAVTI